MWILQGKSQTYTQPHRIVVIALFAIMVGASMGCTTASPVETEPLIITTQPPKSHKYSDNKRKQTKQTFAS